MRTYADAGIREYWVANLKQTQLHVFRDMVNGEYQSQQILLEGTISPLAFPDIAIDVRRLIS